MHRYGRFAARAAAGAVLGLAGSLLAGCFSIDHARFVRSNDEHVLVSNYGWYLFHYIPLVCGNASRDRWLPWVMFRNDVRMDSVQGRFMDYAGDRKARDLAYTTRETVMLEIPATNFSLPVPYLLTYREIQLSGVLEDPFLDPAQGGRP